MSLYCKLPIVFINSNVLVNKFDCFYNLKSVKNIIVIEAFSLPRVSILRCLLQLLIQVFWKI
jgi:hypothetical protein